MGCHPEPIDELIFFRGAGIPPTSYIGRFPEMEVPPIAGWMVYFMENPSING